MEFLPGNHVITLADAVRIRSAIFMGKLQNIIAEIGIPIRNDLIQKEQSIPAVFSLGLLQMALPQVRKLVEETGMLSSTGLLAKGGHILGPVIDLFAAAIAAFIGAHRLVVVEEFNVVIVDLGLYGLTRQLRIQTVLVVLNGHKTILADTESCIAEYREGIFRKRQQTLCFLLPQFLDRNLVLVVVPLGILLAPVPKIFIEIFKGCNGRNGNESVSAAVTHLVFYITLFIAGGRIAEIRLEPVMKHETVETVGKDTLRSSSSHKSITGIKSPSTG